MFLGELSLFIRLILLFILIGSVGCSPKFSFLNLKSNIKTIQKETVATVLPKISKTEPEKKRNIDSRQNEVIKSKH